MIRRLYWHVPHFLSKSDEGQYAAERKIVETEDEANAISSLTNAGGKVPFHLPVIDLDVPARLVPSSTEGHSHLYIDVPMTWEQFECILEALVDAGVVEAGYLNASRERKTTFVRKPGVLKGAE